MTYLCAKFTSAALLALTLGSCSAPDRDIRVTVRGGQFAIDYPWSLWRLVGLQDRTYCIRRVQLYDASGLIWLLNTRRDVQCERVRMPIDVGKQLNGFNALGNPAIQTNETYGVAIDGIGHGRVAFVYDGKSVENITDGKAMAPPCGYMWHCDAPVRNSGG